MSLTKNSPIGSMSFFRSWPCYSASKIHCSIRHTVQVHPPDA